MVRGQAQLHVYGNRKDVLCRARGCRRRDVHRASDVIGRIRDFAMKGAPKRDNLDVNGVIVEVIALIRTEAIKHDVIVQTLLADNLPPILGDRIQLQQVMVNLIMNAIEAMSGSGDGPRELMIRTAEAEARDVLVAVMDSGPGLGGDPEQLFDAFYTTKPGGMGIGLSISRSIIDDHGGRLWASANKPNGAVFQFTLPTHSDRAS